MLRRCLIRLRQRVQRGVDARRTRVSRWTTPCPVALTVGLAADLPRSRHDLLLENALLRQQLLVLRRTAGCWCYSPVASGPGPVRS